MAEAADRRHRGPRLDDKHTLTYLKVTTKTMRVGPNKIVSNASTSKRELMDTLRQVATQHSESSKFAMQNHIAAEASGGWWSVSASHDHQYETNTSDAKQKNESERALTDAFGSMSLNETYELNDGDVYVETVAIKCHKFTVKGKEDEVHCIHYPAQTASIVGPVNRKNVLSYAKMYFLDFESWRPVFAALDMHDVANDVGYDRNELEEKLKTKVYKPGKKKARSTNQLIEYGTYLIKTTKHSDGSQPAGWGLACFPNCGAKRNNVSSWVHVHSGDHWPCRWQIKAGKKPNTYRIYTCGHVEGGQKAGWGLSAWGAHGAVRNNSSSWVAVHEGEHWPMDWQIVPGKRSGTYRILTTEHRDGKMFSGWGLSAWHFHGANRRNDYSSRVAVHEGDRWPMDWVLQKV